MSHDQEEVRYLVKKCVELFRSGIYEPKGSQSPLFEPAVTQLFIWLHDALQRADDLGKRVAFRDDIPEEQGDVTDLISKLRNTVCHMRSKNAMIDTGTFRLNVVYGEVPKAFGFNGRYFGSDYKDDVAIVFGPYRIYVRRHAVRATQELVKIFEVEGV